MPNPLLHATAPTNALQAVEWHRTETAPAATLLESDVTRGIDDAEAVARLDRFGANVLEERVSRPLWQLLWDQVSSTLVVVLLVAASVSFAVGSLNLKTAVDYNKHRLLTRAARLAA